MAVGDARQQVQGQLEGDRLQINSGFYRIFLAIKKKKKKKKTAQKINMIMDNTDNHLYPNHDCMVITTIP